MATIQDLGKVAYFNKGAYDSETTYEINDVVSYQGSSYVSLGNDNTGNLPTNDTYWSVVASKGEKGDTGDRGVKGDTGNGILNVVKTSTEGLIDTYTINYTDGNTTTYKVANGKGIVNIAKTGTSGLVDTYTVTYNDGTTSTYTVTNGEDGEVTQKQLDETNENVSWLQTLTEQMPHVVGQGTDLSLQDVLNYRLIKFLPQGVSSQEGEPTPTTPIPVKSVTRENSVVLQNENLLPNNGLNSYTVYDVQYTKNNDSSITVVGTASGSSADYYLFGSNQDAGNYLHIPQGDYSLKSLPNEFVYIFREKTLGTLTNPTVIKNALLGQDCYFYGIAVRVTRNMSVNTTIYPMLVKGSTAPSTYIEHEEQNYQLSFGNMEFNSSPDGTIRDQIVGSPNEWYKREYIGKVVLNGSENYSTVGTNTTDKKRIQYSEISNLIKKPENNSTLAKIICSHFVNKTANQTYALEQGISVSGVGNVIVYDLDNQEGNTTVFKEWLSNNNMTILYEKVEYTDIPITDTTLINQLNNIYNNAHSYNGVTNITTTYEDGNEQMYLDIELLKNVWDTSL